MRLAAALLAPAVTVAAADEPADAPQRWAWHAQTTFAMQRKPALRSPYEGPNSLVGRAESSRSWSADVSFGARIGPASEIWWNPEAALGVPPSNLLGLSGFPNGELAKTSGPSPTFYTARVFVRHTFALPGATPQPLAPGATQLGGAQPSRRVVLTAGRFALLDVFDAGAAAHDPRTQFMNWALMTHASFDYPADARGYTEGAAVEAFDGPWEWRVGRFALPKVPNQLAIDRALARHHGDVVEVVRRWNLGDDDAAPRPGALRLLAWRLRATMAGWDDALALADASGRPPALQPARLGERTKRGAGFGVEQDAGGVVVFAKWMRADGATEAEAFTEADASWSIGAVADGRRWARPDDAVGLALARSSLSAGHRTFLARGGLGVFLGDGRLTYAPEQVIEAWWRVRLPGAVDLTLDVQRLVHPGHNADRGPASVVGLRLHREI